MKFLQLAALALGATASLESRDLAAFQNSFNSLTGDFVNLNFALTGPAAQFQAIANNFKALSSVIGSQPQLSQEDSALSIAPFRNKLIAQYDNATNTFIAQKDRIAADPNCAAIKASASAAVFWGAGFMGFYEGKVDPVFRVIIEVSNNQTTTKLNSAIGAVICQ